MRVVNEYMFGYIRIRVYMRVYFLKCGDKARFLDGQSVSPVGAAPHKLVHTGLSGTRYER